MPKPRAPKIDWLLEAWNLATRLADVPARRLTLGSLGPVPLDESVESYLASLQIKLNEFLNYSVTIKLGAGQAKALPKFDGDDSRHLIAARNELRRAGMDFDERATAAIFVHAQIGFVRQHLYLDDTSRITLPVTLAAIAGKSAALTNAINASGQHNVDRRGRIARIVADERKRDPFATCLEVLNRICDSNDLEVREVIQGYKDDRLFYLDKNGKEASIGLDRFENIFSLQKPSTG